MTFSEMTPEQGKAWKHAKDCIVAFFSICTCQRKVKTIVDNMYSIYQKLEDQNFNFTGAEWVLIAMMDKRSNTIIHGTNCEYPILCKDDLFWKFILETKDQPWLIDN